MLVIAAVGAPSEDRNKSFYSCGVLKVGAPDESNFQTKQKFQTVKIYLTYRVADIICEV